MNSNSQLVVIEGDDTVDVSKLRVLTDAENIDVVFISSDDELSPEPIELDIAPEQLASVSYSLLMSKVLVSLKSVMQRRMGDVVSALDCLRPNPAVALNALLQIEREIESAKRQIDQAPKGRTSDNAD